MDPALPKRRPPWATRQSPKRSHTSRWWKHLQWRPGRRLLPARVGHHRASHCRPFWEGPTRQLELDVLPGLRLTRARAGTRGHGLDLRRTASDSATTLRDAAMRSTLRQAKASAVKPSLIPSGSSLHSARSRTGRQCAVLAWTQGASATRRHEAKTKQGERSRGGFRNSDPALFDTATHTNRTLRCWRGLEDQDLQRTRPEQCFEQAYRSAQAQRQRRDEEVKEDTQQEARLKERRTNSLCSGHQRANVFLIMSWPVLLPRYLGSELLAMLSRHCSREAPLYQGASWVPDTFNE